MKNNYCGDFRMFVSPLHHVMAKGSTAMVLSCLQHFGHHKLNSRDSIGQTPLYYAIFRGYRYGVNLLLDRGASININDNDNNTPLHCAVKKGNINIVLDLLTKGADLEQRNNYGQTVLQCAIVWNYSKTFELMVKLLLSKGAYVNVQDNDMETPLHSAAARKDSKSVILLLLERGANVSVRDKRGNTPLHVASMKQYKEAIVILIVYGANVEETNNLGDTSLHIAVKNVVPESLKLLIELKAHINAKNIKGQTALHMATNLGRDDLIKILIDHGASLDEKDNRGNTALHYAAKRYHGDKTAEILLERGASTNAYNDCCETPLKLGLVNRLTKVSQMILDWEVNVNSLNSVSLPNALSLDQLATRIKHCIKLSCANICVKFPDVKLPRFYFIDFVESAGLELEVMEANRFGHHSLSNIFSNYSDPTFLLNNELKDAITSPNFESLYPIYGYLLKTTFKKAEKRFELLNEAQNSLEIPLPKEIKRIILASLEDIDLVNVIKACKGSYYQLC